MSEWSTEKKVDIICQVWERKRQKELAEQREREATALRKLEENKADVTAPKSSDTPSAHVSPFRQILKSLHLAS